MAKDPYTKFNDKLYPLNDKQDKKVYAFDRRISFIIQSLNAAAFNHIKQGDTFIDTALNIFDSEHLTGFSAINNGSQTTSDVFAYYKQLRFSDKVIADKNYEVVLHELAHAIVYFRYGYHYQDAHGEIFLHALMSLINKHFNIKLSFMEELAENSSALFFSDGIQIDKEITKEEYSLLSKDSYLIREENNHGNSYFEQYNGFNLNKLRYVCLFKNGDHCWHFERDFFGFEKNLYVDSFAGKEKHELVNFVFLSPIFKVNDWGIPTDNGKHFVYLKTTYDNSSMTSSTDTILHYDSKTASMERKTEVNQYKKSGYNVTVFTHKREYNNVSEFYKKRITEIEINGEY